ncbi:MAG: metallophosphoesterase family protein [Thermoplasmatota archaeon]
MGEHKKGEDRCPHQEFIHLSDLHFGKCFGLTKIRERNEAVIEHIGENHPGIPVLITGDIVDSGFRCQYKKAKEELTKLAKTNPILLVPGNHDYNHLGNFINVKADDRWKEFFGVPMGWENGSMTLNKHNLKPERAGLMNWLLHGSDKFDGLGGWESEDWVVYGIDSGDPRDRTQTARGYVSEELRKRLKKELEDEKRGKDRIRIVMLHHHPFMSDPFMVLKGADELMDVLRGNCEVLLFGHRHKYHIYKDKEYEIPLIIASHSTPEHAFSHYLIVQLFRVFRDCSREFGYSERLEMIHRASRPSLLMRFMKNVLWLNFKRIFYVIFKLMLCPFRMTRMAIIFLFKGRK